MPTHRHLIKSKTAKIIGHLDAYPKCFIVGADNVGSKQIRLPLQGTAIVLMGKNTMMGQATGSIWKTPELWRNGCPVPGAGGVCVCQEDFTEVRNMLLLPKVPAAARAAAMAPWEDAGQPRTPVQEASGGKGTTEFTSDMQMRKPGRSGRQLSSCAGAWRLSQRMFNPGRLHSPEQKRLASQGRPPAALPGWLPTGSLTLGSGPQSTLTLTLRLLAVCAA